MVGRRGQESRAWGWQGWVTGVRANLTGWGAAWVGGLLQACTALLSARRPSAQPLLLSCPPLVGRTGAPVTTSARTAPLCPGQPWGRAPDTTVEPPSPAGRAQAPCGVAQVAPEHAAGLKLGKYPHLFFFLLPTFLKSRCTDKRRRGSDPLQARSSQLTLFCGKCLHRLTLHHMVQVLAQRRVRCPQGWLRLRDILRLSRGRWGGVPPGG